MTTVSTEASRCAAPPLGPNPGNLDLNQLHARAVNSLRMALWYLNQGESNVPGAGRKAVQALAAINVIRTAQQDVPAHDWRLE